MPACCGYGVHALVSRTPFEPRMYPFSPKNLILYRFVGRLSADLSLFQLFPPSVEPKIVPPPPTDHARVPSPTYATSRMP